MIYNNNCLRVHAVAVVAAVALTYSIECLPLYCGQKFSVPGLFGVLWYRCSVCIMSTHSASFSLIRAPNGYNGGGSNAVIRFNFVSPFDFRIIHRPINAATCAPSECPITWNFSTSKPSSTQSKIVSDTFVASYRYVCMIRHNFRWKKVTDATHTRNTRKRRKRQRKIGETMMRIKMTKHGNHSRNLLRHKKRNVTVRCQNRNVNRIYLS